MIKNYIERYVAEVGKHLPAKDRADIRKEIQSTLEDMLEERSQKNDGTATEEMVIDLLKEFGEPRDVAAHYQTDQYLIGPQLYPFFTLVASIVLPLLAVVLLITMGLGSFRAGMSAAETLATTGKILLEMAGAVISALGSIVLTFAILERIFVNKPFGEKMKSDLLEEIPGSKVKGAGKEQSTWDPRELPEIKDVEQYSIPGLVAEVVFTLIAMVVFNFFPQVAGIGFLDNDRFIFQQVLSEAFFGYLPYLNALWALQITLDIFLLVRGRWESVTRWVHIALTSLGIALATVMLFGPDLVVRFSEIIHPLDPGLIGSSADIFTWMPQAIAKGILVVIIALNSVDLLKRLWMEITRQYQSPTGSAS